MSKALRVALAGLGTVGAGVIKLIDTNREIVERRAGRAIEIVAVSARDRTRDRGVDLARFDWVDDAAELAARDDIDVVVELIGGDDGPGEVAVAACDLPELHKEAEGFAGLDPCIFAVRDGIAEAFHGQVVACVFSVIVIVLGLPGGGIAGYFQVTLSRYPGCADMSAHQYVIKIVLLGGQCHPFAPDGADALRSGDPGIAGRIESDVVDLVAQEPASAEAQ